MSPPSNASSFAATAQSTRSAPRETGASLDQAAIYLRKNIGSLTYQYAMAVAPLTVAFWLWVDAISAQDRADAKTISWLILVALIWRWIGVAWFQTNVACRLAGTTAPSRSVFIRRLPHFLLARLTAHTTMVVGSLLIVPGLWGFYACVFTAPITYAQSPLTNAVHTTGQALKLGKSNTYALFKHSGIFTLWCLVVTGGLILTSLILVHTILPNLLGIDTSMAAVSMGSAVWLMFVGFVVFCFVDLFFSVAAVFFLRQLQAKKTGQDLVTRLRRLEQQS